MAGVLREFAGCSAYSMDTGIQSQMLKHVPLANLRALMVLQNNLKNKQAMVHSSVGEV